MSRSRRSGAPKKSSLGNSVIRGALPSVSPTVTATQQRLHIDWKQINVIQCAVILFCFLFLTLFALVPVLNEYRWLRPHASALAQIMSGALIGLAAFLSTGLISFRKVKVWPGLKSRQIFFDCVISTIVTGVILVSVIQFPTSPNPNLSRVPYPPYQQGTLVLDGMPSKPSSQYYWVQSQASCRFVGSGYYVMTTKQDPLAWCRLANADFRNFALEIDMSFVKPGIASIYFQLTDQVSYALDIQSMGKYAAISLGVLSGLNEKHLSYRPFIQSMPIVTPDGPVDFSPGSTNRIAIVVINQTITAYVNGLTTKSWQRTDDSSSHGSIAVAAFTPSDQHDTQTEVVLSTMRLWTL